MIEALRSNNDLIISYFTLRKTLGLLGILLPFVLVFGNWIIFRDGLENSISSYYHTGMGDVFVGILFAMGLFLFSYKGYTRWDDYAGDLACLFAIGVALFPTTPENSPSDVARIFGQIHLAFAALLFLTFAYFALFLFTKTHPGREPTRRKRQRNLVYKACGAAIVLCIGLIVIVNLLPSEIASPIHVYKPVFLLEAIAVVAFGVSWLFKGEALLRDET
ncbi:MAG: DUF998 domain-containing protein [Chloroflexi bacterium]|nr:DUF998 domain-containing protein [Chloroflexota bacterium]MCH8351266.1 DUF998 domain-containing protein [Chloroflexota bacterium]